MFSASDLRKGLKVEIDGVPYAITEFTFTKPGKGQALYNCKMKSLTTGTTMSKTFRSVDKIGQPSLSEVSLRFSYKDLEDYVFMDDNYEQVTIPVSVLGDMHYFLVEDLAVGVLLYNDTPIEVTLPTFVEKEIIRTEPGARGNTATNVMKPASLDTGYEIQVPLFVNEGDIIKVDTRTGKYSDRVSKK